MLEGKRKLLDGLASGAMLLVGMVAADAMDITPQIYQIFATGVGVTFVGYQVTNIVSKKIKKNGG